MRQLLTDEDAKELRENMRIPKAKPVDDPEYREYVRSLVCYVCAHGKPVEPHHMETGGTGMKGSDYSCVPLCTRHHREAHDVGKETFEEQYKLSLWRGVARTLILWLDCALGG